MTHQIPRNVLWDLDGTIIDPKTAITRCIQFALEAHGRKAPIENELLWVIGPPLQSTFAQLVPGLSEKEIWSFIGKYRERFAEYGVYENTVYPQIPGVLRALAHKKHFVATSKPHFYASKITDHFGLTPHFQKVYGSELNGDRTDKGALIAHILETEQIAKDDVVMIGDRKHDIVGAKKVGIRSFGITWGYGSHSELADAGADQIFASPLELAAELSPATVKISKRL